MICFICQTLIKVLQCLKHTYFQPRQNKPQIRHSFIVFCLPLRHVVFLRRKVDRKIYKSLSCFLIWVRLVWARQTTEIVLDVR